MPVDAFLSSAGALIGSFRAPWPSWAGKHRQAYITRLHPYFKYPSVNFFTLLSVLASQTHDHRRKPYNPFARQPLTFTKVLKVLFSPPLTLDNPPVVASPAPRFPESRDTPAETHSPSAAAIPPNRRRTKSAANPDAHQTRSQTCRMPRAPASRPRATS